MGRIPPFVFREKIREAKHVAWFYLAPRDGELLSPYRPGQFLAFRIFVPEGEEPAIPSYSLSDSKKPDTYHVTIKLVAQDLVNQKRGW